MNIVCQSVVQTIIEKFIFAKGQLKKPNIVEEKCTVIVNAANPQLSHEETVASALDETSNAELQHHSDKYAAYHGNVPVGSVALTMVGGRLQCKICASCRYS